MLHTHRMLFNSWLYIVLRDAAGLYDLPHKRLPAFSSRAFRQIRIRVIVPNLIGHDATPLPATYHAFASAGADAPNDGRPVYAGLRPDFVWPDPA